jgi:Flp pilus assembly pilin Flp
MNRLVLKVYITVRNLIAREQAQDMVEHALALGLISMICIAGLNNFATAISTVFKNIDKALF